MQGMNPQIFEWARSNAGLTLEEAAHALGIASSDRLKAIEDGSEVPTRPLLLKMSKQYRRSLLTFYLAAPPKKGDRGQDFRTLPPDRSLSGDALLDALIRDLRARQSLVRATLELEEEQEPLAFIGSAQVSDDVAATARTLQSTMKVDLSTYRGCKTPEDAFAYLRECAENMGIFVLLVSNLGSYHTTIPVEVFRGYVIADPIAPFVVINDQDARTAWSFTLVHEIAHLLLGSSGVSGTHGELAIEQFCNAVAGELLLPRIDLQTLKVGNRQNLDEMLSLISAFAGDRHISREMVAYSLYKTGAINWPVWQALNVKLGEMRAQEKLRQAARKQRKEGPSYYVVRRYHLGRALLEFANLNVNAGTLSPVKAAKILGVNPRSVYPLLVDMPQRRFGDEQRREH
jgi:Zn-dependent peptidase ImmA (M78 family)